MQHIQQFVCLIILKCLFQVSLTKKNQLNFHRYYVNRRLFMADMARIFSNCRLYNSSGTEYVKCANNLERYFQTKMKEIGLWDK